eukprot:scaffold319266_cov15-Prasinocladus_malaysianus.AAC.1
MMKKCVGVQEIYDARALRIIVDDMGGKREAAAIAACYRLLPAVHRLWRPVWGETDDYIANPKVDIVTLASYNLYLLAVILFEYKDKC